MQTRTLGPGSLFLLIALFLAGYASVTAAATPSGRIDYAMAYFPPLDAVIMHGGWSPPAWTPLAETWKLDDQGWSLLSLPGAPAMTHHSMTYDSNRQVLVLCGRRNYASNTDFTFETWEFDGIAWTRGADLPTAITFGDVEIAYDPARQVTVLFGAAFNAGTSETWEYNGNAEAWTRLEPAARPPDISDGALMGYDPRSDSVVLVGMDFDENFLPVNQTWQWDGVTWSRMTAGSHPPNTFAGGLAFDQARDELVLLTSDMSTYGFAGPATGWVPKTPPASPPYGSNAYFALTYHQSWQVALFFGGEVHDLPESAYPDSTWQWDGATWSEWTPAPALPGDVNGDGGVDLTDAILSLMILTGMPLPAGTVIDLAADLNHDGRICMAESLYILGPLLL